MDSAPGPDWRIIDDQGFNTHIGPIRFRRQDETTWQAQLDLVEKHMNMGGVCHGGVYMALTDVAMGAAAHAAADHRRCATIEFSGHFLAAAKLGQTLEVESRLNRLVSGVVFMECDVMAGGRLCFRASGIWKLLGI